MSEKAEQVRKNFGDIIAEVAQDRDRARTEAYKQKQQAQMAERAKFMARIEPLHAVLRDLEATPKWNDKLHIFLEDSPHSTSDPYVCSRDKHYAAQTRSVYIGIRHDEVALKLRHRDVGQAGTGDVIACADNAADLVPELISQIADMARHRGH